MFDPSLYHGLNSSEAELVRAVTRFTEKYFQDPKFDASHDFAHVLRVTATAVNLLEQEQKTRRKQSLEPYDPLLVILGAIMHDVDDKKYVSKSDLAPKVKAELLKLGCAPDLAIKCQILVEGVSYSAEIKNPQRVRDLLITIPELAIVQDADRLDAIGAVGIGRCFAYGGAKTDRSLSHTMKHFDEKLVKLEGMMKTQEGRRLAATRTNRLKQFMSWWQEEQDFASSR